MFGPAVEEVLGRCEIPTRRYRFNHGVGPDVEAETERVVRLVWECLPKDRTFRWRDVTRPLQEEVGSRRAYAFNHLVRVGIVERVGRGEFRRAVDELPEDPLAIPSHQAALDAVRLLIERADTTEDGRAMVPRHRLLCLLDAAAI